MPSRRRESGIRLAAAFSCSLHTDDFAGDVDRDRARGVRFVREPRHEPYGTVAVFEDLDGTSWDLIEPA